MPWIKSALVCLLLTAGAAAQQQASQPATAGPAPPPAPPRAAMSQRFAVVLDAAHGGTDTGARLAPGEAEKDWVLGLSVRLRSALSARGIMVFTSRESDVEVKDTARAELANHARAAACLVLHATATGVGVHLFTSSLQPGPQSRLLNWDSAQSAYLSQSLRLQGDISSALGKAQVPATLVRTSMEPLDSMACPAVVVEVASLPAVGTRRGRNLDDPTYQSQLVETIAAALLAWRSEWRIQP